MDRRSPPARRVTPGLTLDNGRRFQARRSIWLRETGILTSASDYHIFLKLGRTRTQALESYLDIVNAALDTGIPPRCQFEDITRADFDGFVVPFAV